MGFSATGKSNHSHMVLLDTPLHVDAVTDVFWLLKRIITMVVRNRNL
jgi:hypothetical protein